MKIYTKRGDKGETSLIGGTRVPKHHTRIEAYGTVDELNSYMGLIQSQPVMEKIPELQKQILAIQNQLFSLGSILASDPKKSRMKLPEIVEADIEALEKSIDEMEGELQPLRNFVLPGGHPANAMAHLARTVCRRAERRVVALNETEEVLNPVSIQFLNRLSDWLFVLSRYISHHAGAEEILWKP